MQGEKKKIPQCSLMKMARNKYKNKIKLEKKYKKLQAKTSDYTTGEWITVDTLCLNWL